ncbi:hypothetical protein P5673_026719 [Acropora cervicornis]|uniref:Uncharacterized protein n=1 Tax=Acropora cervicornis TaxID=6130 RepID=A0AAD9PZU8_ACRCE|nr:hypothetical protein P5673_026719 [Acropora cervicornis]
MDAFLKLNKTDKAEQLGERSASEAHANIIFGRKGRTGLMVTIAQFVHFLAEETYQIAEILWVNQQGALEKQLHPGEKAAVAMAVLPLLLQGKLGGEVSPRRMEESREMTLPFLIFTGSLESHDTIYLAADKLN